MTTQNGTYTHAGVYQGVLDNSDVTQIVPTSSNITACVGVSKRGPVGRVVKTTSWSKFKAMFGKSDHTVGPMHVAAQHYFQYGNQFLSVRLDLGQRYGYARIYRNNGLATIEPAAVGLTDPKSYVFQSNDIAIVYAANPGTWNQDIKVDLYPDPYDADNEKVIVRVYEGGDYPLNTYKGVMRDLVENNKQLNLQDVLEKDARIRIRINENLNLWANSDGQERTINALVSGYLSGGTDGRAPVEDDYIDALALLENTDTMDIRTLITCGYYGPNFAMAVHALAEKRRDCLAAIDAPIAAQMNVAQLIDFRRTTLGLSGESGSYATIEASDIEVADDNLSLGFEPASSVVAAMRAKNDLVSPYMCPAGIRTVIDKTVYSLRRTYNVDELVLLDAHQINPIVFRTGDDFGYMIFGGNTLHGGDSVLTDVQVRRIINTVESNLRKSAAALIGDFPDEDQFVTAYNLIDAQLKPVQQGRGINRYAIKVDSENNTTETRARGDLIAQYMIVPNPYTRRILITAALSATGQVSSTITTLLAEDTFNA